MYKELIFLHLKYKTITFMKKSFPLGLALFLIWTGCMFAQVSITEKTVAFERGKSSATVTDHIQGEETIDYLLGAKEGQTMTVEMTTNHTVSYFNVLPPNDPTALYNSSMGDNSWTGVLPASGTYKVRVYLMRNAARRNEKADYTISFAITGSPSAMAHDAKVAGTNYHATGLTSCSVGTDPKGSAQCEFGVIRKGMDKAEVHISTPGGAQRVLEFDGDKVTSPDASLKIRSKRENYDWEISVDDMEFFNIPDAVINGG